MKVPILPNGVPVGQQEKPDLVNTAKQMFDAEFINRIFDASVLALLIVFALGILVMILAAIFKNGQWQKYAQGTLLWSFISIIILRGVGLVVVTIQQNAENPEMLLQMVLTWMTQCALFLGMIGICVGLMFKFGHKLIKHPDYHKSSKLSFSVSVLMILLALFVPPIINLTN